MWSKKPALWIENDTLHISVVFTWDLPKVRQLAKQKSLLYGKVLIGGPAVRLMPDYLNGINTGYDYEGALQKHNPDATRTTTGCVRQCKFCAVPRLEGGLKELKAWPDKPTLIDNNLLASGKRHFDRVIDRLKKYDEVDFNQGLDSRLLSEYHAKRFKELNNPMIRLALDSVSYQSGWVKAFETLRSAGIPKGAIRSYALVGFDSGPAEAWARCKFIESRGIKALPVWFHELDSLKKGQVTEKQEGLGWNDYERRKIMQFFYFHKNAVKH